MIETECTLHIAGQNPMTKTITAASDYLAAKEFIGYQIISETIEHCDAYGTTWALSFQVVA